MKSSVTVLYTCAACNLVDREVEVPAKEVDIVKWLEHIVLPRVMVNHGAASPGCKPKTFTNLKLPIGPASA